MFRHSVAGTFAAVASVALACCLVAMTPSPASAAEIKLLGPVAMRALLPNLLAQFEKSSGHKVTVKFATIGAITDRVMKGEAADVAVVSGAQNEELQKQGKLLAGGSAELARIGYTVLVKTGAAKPDLGSVDAFKRTLLAANSIALGDPARGGGSGVYMAGLIQNWGLAAELKTKTKLFPSGTEVAESVAKGETEIGVGVTSDLSIVPGLVSIPLPAEVQSYTMFTAGIPAGSKQADAGKALIAFLKSPAVKQAMTAQGFEPR